MSTRETGGPLCGDNFRKRVFFRFIELADVPRFRFHNIRHTFASLLLANGESLHYVKEQSYHEITEELRVPLGTVKVWLYRARTQLRREFEKLGMRAIG